jgi:hypothetical protein
MRGFSRLSVRVLSALVVAIVAAKFPSALLAQGAKALQRGAVESGPLITQPVNEAQLTILKGNTHPLARPEFDLGTAPATLPMQRMLLVLKRSPEQESALRKLLDDQQDKSSPNYHQWLTPAQFGQQFGPTDSDVQTITSWLQSHGFQVSGVANGRNTVEFSGSASQVQEAFHTTIHKYVVKGEQYWANSSDPSIPAALGPAVAGLASLNNFPRKPMNRYAGGFSREKATGKIHAVTPLFTYQPYYQCSADNYCFAVGPYDFATIYNVLPLWNANINGTGQTIAIVGESNIVPQDIANFRSLFGLPANSTTTGNPLNIILNGPDPGLQGDESEADIDVEWSGAVAPYATIDFVVSQSTETTAGTDLSAVYIVDNNLAPVMSESYGSCELGLGTTGNQFYNALWQQAAAQGITVFISAGDNGSAGCDDFDLPPPAPAQFGLEVSGYASTPYNVAVGGTDFNEFTNPEAYWSVTNNSTTQASALGYIPETTWNDSCTNAIWETIPELSSNPETNCNNSQLNDAVPVGGSGGVSNCTTPTGSAPANCSGGYAKPSWQTGSGVPDDGKRDLPDVSLFASNGFAGSLYIVCEADQPYGSCSSTSPEQTFLGFGGTSVSSPAFAGIMALVNQETGSRQGNANYVFYKLAAKDTLSECNSSSKPASSCIFNDVTSGTNAMPCATNSPNCSTTIGGDQYGILTGYNTGTGYDLATGLGSVNANNLVTQWSSVTSLPSKTTLNSLTPTTITHGQPVNFSVTVAPASGTGTPTGQISLLGGTTNGSGIGAFTLSGGTFSGTTELLPGGTYSVTAHYPGDGTYGSSDSNQISITVNKENSESQLFLVTFDSSGNLLSPDTNTAVYGSPYILRVNVENSGGALCTPVGASGGTGCPTGTVTLTENGTALDNGTYTLNSYGYFEDFAVQLTGGTNSVKAQYAGDNSFDASSATSAFTITPANTSTTLCCPFGNYTVGQNVSATASVNAVSSGAFPTGTVLFYDNGKPLAGTVSYSTQSNQPGLVELNAALSTTLSAPGNHSITATYGGDSNYGGSAAGAMADYAYYSTTTTLGSSSLNPPAGTAVILTALVDTSVKNLSPTGTVTFGTPPGTVSGLSATPVTDGNGNSALQVTESYIPSVNNVTVAAQYSGDTNYSPSGSTQVFITVAGNDFLFTAQQGPLILTAGQTGEIGLTVDGQSGYSGTINFSASSCSNLPALSSCSFTPASLTGTGFVSLFVATAAPGAQKLGATTPSSTGRALFGSFLLGGTFLLCVPLVRRRSFSLLILAVVLTFLLVLPGCGGGNGGGAGGGSGPPGTPAGTYTVTVTATTSSLSHTTTFQLVVN